MSNELILGTALVCAGLYITYQTYLIARYRRVLNMAQYAMQGLLIDLLAADKGESDDTGEHD